MIKPSYNDVFKGQQGKLVRATFKRGIINSINLHSNTVDVQIVGNQSTIVKNVPISSAINLSLISIGDKCRLDMFDETNPKDMVVAYTYGGSQKPRVIFASGYFEKAAGTGSTGVIQHGLGVIPDFYGFTNGLYSASWMADGSMYITGVTANDINISVTTTSYPLDCYWFAVKFM